MKLNYKLKLISVLIGSGFLMGNADAFSLTSFSTVITVQNSDNWVLVQNENGIKVYFSKITIAGKPHLKIKFENTTTEIVDFTWSLKKFKTVIITESKNRINSSGAIEFYDSSMLIPIEEGESLNNFSVITNLN